MSACTESPALDQAGGVGGSLRLLPWIPITQPPVGWSKCIQVDSVMTWGRGAITGKCTAPVCVAMALRSSRSRRVPRASPFSFYETEPLDPGFRGLGQ